MSKSTSISFLGLLLPMFMHAAPALALATAPAASADRSILRAQVLLERARYSPGEIDGRSGSNLRKAILGYQRSQGLTASGTLDAATWTALESDAAPALVEYTLTAADVAGPYTPLPAKVEDKAKLPSMGFENLSEALGERFHASPKLLKSLNAGKPFDVAGQTIRVPNVEGLPALATASKLVVDKSDMVLTLLDAQDKVIAQFPVSAGSSHDPLPIGEWKINGVARNPVFNYDSALFWDAKPERVELKLAAGPNNPVGVVWIDLSKPHYGIHGTPDPSHIGKTESHGCIRLSNWDAALVAASVAPGLPASLRE